MTSMRLSICIATLNRATFLNETLQSIVSQAADEVEIVIVDGASTDNTEQVVWQYQQTFPRLSYLRLLAKGGVDQDYCKAVQLAQGDYCWLMSDDDILKPGAIRAVLNSIQQNYALIIVNSEVRTADLSRVLEPRRLGISADQVYKPSDSRRLFVETANYLSFIGSVVIRRQIWNQREKEKYLGTAFIHVGVIFQKSLPEDVLAIAEPWIILRYGNALWAAKSFEIWAFNWPELIWSFPDYPDSAKQRVWRREPWRRITTLMRYRAKGAFSLQEYYRLLEPRLNSSGSRLAAKIVARLPGCILNFFGIIYYSVFYPRSGEDVIDFKDSHFYYLNCFKQTILRFGQGKSST